MILTEIDEVLSSSEYVLRGVENDLEKIPETPQEVVDLLFGGEPLNVKHNAEVLHAYLTDPLEFQNELPPTLDSMRPRGPALGTEEYDRTIDAAGDRWRRHANYLGATDWSRVTPDTYWASGTGSISIRNNAAFRVRTVMRGWVSLMRFRREISEDEYTSLNYHIIEVSEQMLDPAVRRVNAVICGIHVLLWREVSDDDVWTLTRPDALPLSRRDLEALRLLA